MIKNIIPTTIRLNEETKIAIEDIARLENRSFNKMVEYILQLYVIKYLEDEEKKEVNE